MSSIEFRLEGMSDLIDRLTATGPAAEHAAADWTATGGHVVEREAKAEAPVESGTLQRSIMVDGPHPLGAAVWESRVLPTVIYGRRAELGFYQGDGFKNGLDSLGRQYNQAPGAGFKFPHPYLMPALAGSGLVLRVMFVESLVAALHHG